METPHLDTLQQFTESSLPDLDVVTLGALELFSKISLPTLPLEQFKHPLVLGSGNAEVAGRIIFAQHDAIYADESTYEAKLSLLNGEEKSAVIISASGSKHSVEIAKTLEERGVRVWLITNTDHSAAADFVLPEHTIVLPKNREPYTYNTSTYMSMILAATHEDPSTIHSHIVKEVAPVVPDNLQSYDSFYFLLPPELIGVKHMLMTKFDELFGSKVSARVFTYGQTMHAKTVVPNDRELFISLGVENNQFGAEQNRLAIPLLEQAGPAAAMAIGYYVIGHIQKQHPPYFKQEIAGYVEKASAMFGKPLTVIVE